MELLVAEEAAVVQMMVALLVAEVEALVLGELAVVQMLAVAMQVLVVGVVAAALVAGVEVQEVEAPVVGVVVGEMPVAGESAVLRKKVEVGGGREVMQQVIQDGAVARRAQNLVGMMLRGMGFSNETPIYLASGKIYNAERNLEPLRKMFPLLQTKESLVTADELNAFQGFSSRLAALDYMVCLSSEVFVTTHGGNFPHFLMGHRRFLYNGHAKTITPDKTKLVVIVQNTSISWDSFKDHMELMLAESDRKSIMVPLVKKSTRKGSIYLNPLPECRCLWESQNSSTPPDLYS